MTLEVESVTITCCSAGCGIVFAVPQWWQKKRRDDHTTWYCPNGHGQSYTSDNAEEKLRRERDSLKQQLARVEDEKREAIAAKDREIKQAKRRAAAGTCPCCARSFSNMAEHMKKQHPAFVAEAVNKVVPMKRRKAA